MQTAPSGDSEHVPNLCLNDEEPNDFVKAYLAEQQQSYQKQIEIRQQVISETEAPAASAETTSAAGAAAAPIPEPVDQAEDLSPNKQTRAPRTPRTSVSDSSPTRRSLRSASSTDPSAAPGTVSSELAEQNVPAAEPATSAPADSLSLQTDRPADDSVPALNQDQNEAAPADTVAEANQPVTDGAVPKQPETTIPPDDKLLKPEAEKKVESEAANVLPPLAGDVSSAAGAADSPVTSDAQPVAAELPVDKKIADVTASSSAGIAPAGVAAVEPVLAKLRSQKEEVAAPVVVVEKVETDTNAESQVTTQVDEAVTQPAPPPEEPHAASTRKRRDSPAKWSGGGSGGNKSERSESPRKERHDSSRGEDGQRRDRRRLVVDKKEEVGDEAKTKPKRKWGSGSERQISRGISSTQLNSLLPKTEKVSAGGQEESQTGDAENITMSGKFSQPANGSLGVPHRLPADIPDAQEPEIDQKPVNGQSAAGEHVPTSEEVPAARNPASNVLFVENLTRPFTLPALHSLLKKYGSIDTDKFWTDKIKSMCLVAYASADEAEAARKALYGTRWPPSNPKTLVADFSTEDEIAARRAEAEKPVVQQAAPARAASDKYDITIRKTFADEKETSNKPVRDWDRDKLSSPPPSKRSRRSPSPVPHVDDKQGASDSSPHGKDLFLLFVSCCAGARLSPEPDCPAKLLDDLFKKTSSSPIIYWLPLNEQEAEQRIKLREEEREKRRLDEKTERDAQRLTRRSPPPPPRMVCYPFSL